MSHKDILFSRVVTSGTFGGPQELPALGTTKVDKEMEARIIQLALSDPTRAPRDIYNFLRPIAKESGKFLGGYDAVRKRISKARSTEDPEDKEWEINESLPGISDSALSGALIDVLSVKRWHIIGNTRFTSREGKWVVKLRSAFARRSEAERDLALALKAAEFSVEERSSKLLGRAFTPIRLEVGVYGEMARPTTHPRGRAFTRSQQQIGQLIDRQLGYELPAEFLIRHNVRREAEDDGTVTLFSELEDRSNGVLDDISADIVQEVRDEDGMLPDRELVELVILRAREERSSSKDWQRLSREIKRDYVKRVLGEAQRGDFTKWNSMWT